MENTIKPFIGIIQAYSEVGASLGHLISQDLWSLWLKELNTYIHSDGKMKKKQDYRLIFYICSSSFISELNLKGPTTSKTYKTVEYFLWLPYARVISDPKPLTKLTEYFKQGVAEVLRKLEYSEGSIQKVLEHINDTPIQE